MLNYALDRNHCGSLLSFRCKLRPSSRCRTRRRVQGLDPKYCGSFLSLRCELRPSSCGLSDWAFSVGTSASANWTGQLSTSSAIRHRPGPRKAAMHLLLELGGASPFFYERSNGPHSGMKKRLKPKWLRIYFHSCHDLRRRWSPPPVASALKIFLTPLTVLFDT